MDDVDATPDGDAQLGEAITEAVSRKVARGDDDESTEGVMIAVAGADLDADGQTDDVGTIVLLLLSEADALEVGVNTDETEGVADVVGATVSAALRVDDTVTDGSTLKDRVTRDDADSAADREGAFETCDDALCLIVRVGSNDAEFSGDAVAAFDGSADCEAT